MTATLSRILSPATLLYSALVIYQFALGLYLVLQIEPPGALALLSWATFLWSLGWWLQTDSRKRGVALVYDMGLFLYVAWPIVMPYHLVKTRRGKGLLVILGFVGAYMAPAIVGIILGALVIAFRE